MRRRRGEPRILARCAYTLCRDRRRVVAVDQVVGHAGVIRVLPELLLQDRRRLEVRRVGLVRLRLRARDVERREDLRFVVGRVARRERLVRLRARCLPVLLRARREVPVVRRHRFDVVALALRLRADAPSFVDRGLRLLRTLGRSALSGERIDHQYRSDAPVGDRALRVGLQHVAECLLAGREPERMQHGDGAIERGLHLGIAARRKGNLAHHAGLRIGLVRKRRCAHAQGNNEGNERGDKFHGVPRFLRTNGGGGQCAPPPITGQS